MCARYTLTVPDFATLARLLEIAIDRSTPEPPDLAALYQPRYNAAPKTVQLVLRARDDRRELVAASWGLVNRWVKDPSAATPYVNARSEGARTKPAFRDAFAHRRCVVPADGFYEWTGPKKDRRPIWFHPRAGGLLHLAGLYETWHDPATGEGTRTFTILTTASSGLVAPVHDRMPVILDPAQVDAWLGRASPDQAEALLRPAPPGLLAARPVSRRVNAVEADDPSLLREEAQGTLPLFADLDPGRTRRGSA
jgi:putative SOS response-associated peptidase YedK